MRARSFPSSASCTLAAAAGLALALFGSTFGVSLSAGCGEGFAEQAAGQAPVFVRSPSRSAGGSPSFPQPDAGSPACTAPATPLVSAGACVPNDAPRVLCNPITNLGCLEDSICDYSVSAGSFRCFPPAAQPLCGACDERAPGPFCAQGSTCRGGLGLCTRYCCVDEDCGGGGACVLQPPAPLGICDAVDTTRLATFGVGEFGGTPRLDAKPLCGLLPPPKTIDSRCVQASEDGEARCNPISNEGCVQGEACDVIPGGFRCLPIRLPPASAGGGGTAGTGGASGSAGAFAGAGGLAGAGGAFDVERPIGTRCGACDADDRGGPTCQPGLHCVNGSCARFCCSNDDCGSQPCDKSFFGTLGVGVCLAQGAGGAGGAGGTDGGAAGAGGDAGAAP